jgi:hypothetical protein
MAKRKTWREKLADAKDLPRVVKITGKMSKRWGKGTVVIPAPAEVDAIMTAVPPGQLITIDEIRARLAHKHGATIGCPITTGIFAWIAAHAAEEAAQEGTADITPYWRTLKAGGELNVKYPGGVPGLKKLLEAEGHTIVTRGKRAYVADYDQHAATSACHSRGGRDRNRRLSAGVGGEGGRWTGFAPHGCGCRVGRRDPAHGGPARGGSQPAE